MTEVQQAFKIYIRSIAAEMANQGLKPKIPIDLTLGEDGGFINKEIHQRWVWFNCGWRECERSVTERPLPLQALRSAQSQSSQQG